MCAVFTLSVLDPPSILAIRELYQNTGTGISRGIYPVFKLGFPQDADAVYSFYRNPETNKLAKIVKEQKREKFLVHTEFLYYPNGVCAFIFENTILNDERGSLQRRIYISEGRDWLRYIKTIDSKAEVYDEDLARFNTELIPLINRAWIEDDWFNYEVSPMFEYISHDNQEIYFWLELKSRHLLVLAVNSGEHIWEFTVGTDGDSMQDGPEMGFF